MTKVNEIVNDPIARAVDPLGDHISPEWEYITGMWVQTSWTKGPRNPLWSQFLARVVDGTWEADQSSISDLGIDAAL